GRPGRTHGRRPTYPAAAATERHVEQGKADLSDIVVVAIAWDEQRERRSRPLLLLDGSSSVRPCADLRSLPSWTSSDTLVGANQR
ncbi:MAG: hypothetical protein QOI98_3311, partial [Solirubrobacteraceae bacterium]|nr:hypothetical protein [Solirubrobacteraceae bacterium]